MAKKSRRKKKKQQQRVPSLYEDLVVEILSRVPYRSLCRFKCVSRSWYDLCSDPDLRKKSPQTLSGFFCYSRDDNLNQDLSRRFLNLSGRGLPLVDPSLPFLRGLGYADVIVLQCCGGLLLCDCSKSSPYDTDYIVCNPVTQKWTVLPDTEELHHRMNRIRLAFDPAVPSCFYVFLFVRHDFYGIVQVEIYSSETGVWISRESEWGNFTDVNDEAEHVFFNGTLYAITPKLSLVTVDTEGKIWRKIRTPHSYVRPRLMKDEAFIAHCQGHLYAMHIDFRNDNQLSVWVFKADGNEQWTLKHTTSITKLLGRQQYGQREFYHLIAAHSEQNLIFLTGGAYEELLSYDMDNQEAHVICTLQKYFHGPMLPYTPCFAEWPSDGC
ncbi:unnamed protein product [Urochloa decumbens]|uniref:F-box domain-containing protein n=1 Tax=Urochloa decumbens TaxID=240449 RepID=A0ABC8XVW1_9POAL